jgi:long-chain acyl-CoA synthetase
MKSVLFQSDCNPWGSSPRTKSQLSGQIGHGFTGRWWLLKLWALCRCPCIPTRFAEEMAYVLGHGEVRFAMVEDQEQVDKLLSMGDEVPTLEHVIYDDPRGLRDYEQENLHAFETVQETGRSLMAQNSGLEAEWVNGFSGYQGSDIAVMLYTSGTPGVRRG